jgi:uncharacterized protein
MTTYETELLQWRRERELSLRSPGGWLSMVGLHWLKQGVNHFGSDPGCDGVLAAPGVPPRAFSLHLDGRTVHAKPEPGADVRTQSGPLQAKVVTPFLSEGADTIMVGRLSMHVLVNGDDVGVRVIDRESPRIQEFTGLRWYPVRPDLKVTARFVRHPAGKSLGIPNITGTVHATGNPGYVTFAVGGMPCRLEVLRQGKSNQLFFNFRDATNGAGTYPGGRYLFAPLPPEDESEIDITLDFNRATSPPCALSEYALCLVPPPENVIPGRIEAGEMA